MEKLSNELKDLHKIYNNILLLGDFNITPEDLKLRNFCDTHDLGNLIKQPTCFKGINPTYIDLILKHQKQIAFTTGTMKLTYVKGNPEIEFCRDQKSLDKNLFPVDITA